MSTVAAVVLADIIPLKLVVDMGRMKRDTRGGIDLPKPVQILEDATDKWQQDCASFDKGRWTYRLIPSIGDFTKRKQGQVNFCLTLLLTCYGCYRAYLYKYGYDVDKVYP